MVLPPPQAALGLSVALGQPQPGAVPAEGQQRHSGSSPGRPRPPPLLRGLQEVNLFLEKQLAEFV